VTLFQANKQKEDRNTENPMHDDSKRNVHLSENPTSPALISPPLFLPLLLLLLLLFPAAYSARVVDSVPKTLIPSSHQVALEKKPH
jgi:hypothetical protein